MGKLKDIFDSVTWGELGWPLFFFWVFIYPAILVVALLLLFIVPESWELHTYLVWILDVLLFGDCDGPHGCDSQY